MRWSAPRAAAAMVAWAEVARAPYTFLLAIAVIEQTTI